MNDDAKTDQFICSTCGSANAAPARFCNNCGAPLGVPSSAYAETITASQDDSRTLEATAHDELSGQTIDGRYRIESLIGVGGMGSVYRATRILIGDEVAIKILHTERVADPHAAERFRREAQASARLKHPNAVSIYDFGISSDGLQYLVMELIEGQSLRELMKERGTLEPLLCAEITTQVCAALDEAHRQHIVHRDIKPDNIFLNSVAAGLRVKVLDFGIAKLRDDAASHLTQTGSVMGTPHYMSPEQCLGEELDARADIYSMGVVLYEMLCGRVPFNAPVSTAVVVQHVNQPPPPLSSFNSTISERLARVVLQALEKGREGRPQTAGAFAQQVASTLSPAAWEAITPTLASIPSAGTLSTGGMPPQTLPKDIAPTVHLSNISGPTGPLAPARATAGSGTVSIPVTKRRGHVFAIAGASVMVLIVGGLIFWAATRGSNSNGNSHADEAASHRTEAPMVRIAGGSFVMGSGGLDQDSKPAHKVTVKSFEIDVYEVTCDEYKKCVDAKKCNAPNNWPHGSFPDGAARYPVTGVTWEDATAYAAWVAKRLPTEEEWEFAARGPSELLYPWGKLWKSGCANADNVSNGMRDVGTFKCLSPFGAYDMIGNAWEWTSSRWQPYPNGHLSNAGNNNEKVIRGGSWQSPQTVTTAFRAGLAGAGDQTGFRCARDIQ